MSVDRSRSQRLAEMVSSRSSSDLEKHLDDAVITISVDDEIPQARLTTRTLISTLRRGPGTIMLESHGLPNEFVSEMEEVATAIDPERGLSIVSGFGSANGRSVPIHVGPTSSRPSIRIVPEGYGAHVMSSDRAKMQLHRPGNPLGAVYAAALGAAEVFKSTAQVVPNRRTLHRHLQFCPVALSADLSRAPNFAEPIELDLTLVGIGAIGTGIVLLLDALKAEGRIVTVDPQHFAPENVTTYSIGTFDDAVAAIRKVDLAKRALPRFDVTMVHDTVIEYIRAVDRRDARWSPFVLTALDSPESRCEAQRLWPDHLIDAQTGDTMLGMCDHSYGIDPCMVCIFGVDRSKPSGAVALAELLGLSIEKLADANAIVTEEDIRDAPLEQREFLRNHLKTRVCGLAQSVGLTRLGADDFMPSVPFVSLQAASLSIGRLIAIHQHHATSDSNFVQYDALFGPQHATIESTRPKRGCACQTRVSSIDIVREQRRH